MITHTVTIPGLRLDSEANNSVGSLAQRRKQAAKTKLVKSAVSMCLIAHRNEVMTPPCLVVITRVAPRELDSDNLGRACKAVQDAVAAALGVTDGPRGPLAWRYEQAYGGVRVYGCEIKFLPRVTSCVRVEPIGTIARVSIGDASVVVDADEMRVVAAMLGDAIENCKVPL